MLFEQELRNQLVPEWRAKYLDYKTAKKKLNACELALKKINQTPKFFPNTSRGGRTPQVPGQFLSASATPHPTFHEVSIEENRRDRADGAFAEATQALKQVKAKTTPKTGDTLEEQPLKAVNSNQSGSKIGGNYGSLGTTPPFQPGENSAVNGHDTGHTFSTSPEGAGVSNGDLRRSVSDGAPSLRLPGPAIPSSIKADVESHDHHDLTKTMSVINPSGKGTIVKHPAQTPAKDTRGNPRRAFTSPYIRPQPKPGLFQRYFSKSGQQPQSAMELPLEAYRDFDSKRAEFYLFLDDQLKMVAEFYKQKEDQAVDRFETLQEQLQVLKSNQAEKANAAAEERRTQKYRLSVGLPPKEDFPHPNQSFGSHLKDKVISNIPFRSTKPRRQDTADSTKNPLSDQISKSSNNAVQDYTRRRNDQVPYSEAKSKLKHALQEFYRNLDMLKSYAMLNREAFRKIVKKYDKIVASKNAGKFMSDKVDRSWFVKSDVVDTLMGSVENLYAYFEKGSHKVAANKLRVKHNNDYSPSSFRNGILLGAGGAIGLRGLVYASEHFYNDPNPEIVVQTSFLLQIYGGFFLALILFLAFCIDCRFWMNNRINYVFIFEFDPRSSLDWRQLAEIPSILWFLLGLIMWLNFSPYVGGPSSTLWLYFPAILAGVSAGLVFFPFQHLVLWYPRIKHGSIRLYKWQSGFLYPHSRAWFAFSNFRLFLGGVYPVEFRDFFLGDMYCSLTYAMGNVELFFCLYTRSWNNPPICNSSNSMLFGFFTCLPGIWRALQCLRRYKDSRMAFPHLANFGKYICTILFYMTLSLYRLDESTTKKAVFITFATINSIYVSIWDICFDWSLGTHGGRGLWVTTSKGHQQFGFPTWYYYPAVILDPILRFNWIFYAFIFGELQHSALLSFFVALTEIFRRSVWALFRVENEHMTNVGMFRASRDVPLPYNLRLSRTSSTNAPSEVESQNEVMSTPRRVVTAIAAAHALDFERRKPRSNDSDDDDDEDDGGDVSESDAGGPS